MRLDHDRADRGVSPLDDQLFELVDYSLGEVVVRWIREGCDLDGAATTGDPVLHLSTAGRWLWTLGPPLWDRTFRSRSVVDQTEVLFSWLPRDALVPAADQSTV